MRYQLVSHLYLERFDSEGLLLDAERNQLLQLDEAAADLFEMLQESFAGRTMTVDDGARWLNENYELRPKDCRTLSRQLLAFGLRHRLVRAVGSCGVRSMVANENG